MRTPLLALTLPLALAACSGRPPPAPTAPQPTAEAPEQRLDSGLRWVVEPMPGAPSVAAQLWLPAGAIRDPAAHPGTAALTVLIAEERLRAAVAPIGGRAEGWIRADAAALSVTAAPEQLDAALAALARVVTTPPAAAEVEAARARFATRLVTAAGQPERRALRRLLALAWGTHPGARPLVGVEAPPEDAVEAWRAAHLRPAGAVLVVTGDAQPAAVRGAVGDALGGWSGAPPTSAWITPRPPTKGPVVQIDPREAGPARIRLAWPVPAADPAALAAADALALSLVLGPDAPIPTALRRAGVRAEARAFVHAPGPDGLLILAVDLPAAEIDRGWRALAQSLGHIARHPPDRTRIARVVDALDAAGARAAADPVARAAVIGPRALRWPGARGRWRAALATLDRAALAPLAAGLRPRVTTAWIGTPVPADIDPTLWAEQLGEAFAAEKAPAALAGGFPGVTAQVVPRPGSGVVAIHLRAPAGASTVPPDLTGAAHLAAAALADPLPGLGRPTARLSPDALEVSLTVPAERFPGAMAALLDRLLRPRWTPERVERARAQALRDHRASDPGVIARALLVAELARVAGAPTAEPEAVAAGLEVIPPARVATWFDGFVTHGLIRVTAVGDLDEAALYRALAAAVPSDRAAVEMRPLRPPPDTPAAASPASTVHRIDRRIDGERAAWAVGWSPGPAPDGDVAALEVVLSLVLGAAVPSGSPVDGQLFVEGGPGATRAGLVLAGPAAAVRAAVPGVMRALTERTQVAADPEAITGAIRRRVGHRRVDFGDPAAFAGWLGAQAAAGRTFVGPRALEQWQGALERARGGETLRAARDHLTLERRSEAWVGPGAPPATPDPPAEAPAPTEEAQP